MTGAAVVELAAGVLTVAGALIGADVAYNHRERRRHRQVVPAAAARHRRGDHWPDARTATSIMRAITAEDTR